MAYIKIKASEGQHKITNNIKWLTSLFLGARAGFDLGFLNRRFRRLHGLHRVKGERRIRLGKHSEIVKSEIVREEDSKQ